MFCLTFQAFVQLLWSNRSYTRMMHSHWSLRFVSVSSRQNMWPMLSTFPIAIHNDEYCILLIATIKLNSWWFSFEPHHTPQWCLLTVEHGRCTATWNLQSTYFLDSLCLAIPDILSAMHEVKEWRMLFQHCVCNIMRLSQMPDHSLDAYLLNGIMKSSVFTAT